MTTQAADPLPGVEQRLAGIESRLAALETTMALFLEEQREFRQENNARLGRVETNLTRIYLTIIGLMGTIIVGSIILRVLG